MFGRLFDRYIALVTRFPKSTLFVLLVAVVWALVGIPNFKLDASSDSLTLEHDTDLDFYRDVVKAYGSGDFLVVTFHPEQELFSDDSLELLQRLRKDLLAIDGVVSINSILDVPLLYSPKLSLSEITGETRTLMTPGVDYQQAREEFLTSPVYRNLILSPDGQTTALQMNLAVDEAYIDLVKKRDALRLQRDQSGLNSSEKEQLESIEAEALAWRTEAATRDHNRVEAIRAVVAGYREHAQIYVGGLSMITADMIQFIKNDLVVFGSAVIVFMIVVLAVIFRSLRFVVIPMATCIVAVLLMLGYVSWVDWRLTVISSNFVALLLIISLAIIIHLVVRYREFCEQQPDWDQRQLVTATVKFMALPCLYTVMTSVVAFASLVVSNIRPVIDFGWLMTIGLVLALVLAFTVLPAALMLLSPPGRSNKTAAVKEDKPVTLLFARYVERHGTTIGVVSLLLAIASAWGISRLQVENRFIDYFHASTEIYQGLSVIDTQLGGTTSLDIIIDHPAQMDEVTTQETRFPDENDPFAEGDPFDEGDSFDDIDGFGASDPFSEADPFSEHGASDPGYWMTVAGLRSIEEIHDYLESLPEVGKVQSLAILYKVGNDINGSLNDFELALMQKNLPREVKTALVSPFLSPQNDQTRITLRIHDGYPGLKRAELVDRIRNHLIDTGMVKAENVRFTGLLVLYNNMLQSLFSSQIATLGTVLLGILVMFVLLFRSFKVALVAIVPTIIAALAILGFMGIFGLPLDMMTITVAAITVGIGVDNTIHYVHRFRRELEVSGDYIASMRVAHGSIGRAMFYTSVIIIFGFAIMVLSAFIPTIYFGLLTGLAMFFALLGALLLLPQLILLVRPFDTPAQAPAAPQSEPSL